MDGEKTQRNRLLSGKERTFAGLVGLPAAAAGGVAVFLSDNQAGSVGLLGVGIVMLLLSVTGQPLSRVKIGDSEAEFGLRVMQEAREKIESAPLEEAETVVELVESAASQGPAPDPRTLSAANAFRYEQSVITALRGVSSYVEMPQSRSHGYDALIDGNIAVITKYRGGPRTLGMSSLISGAYGREVREANDAGARAILVVTNAAIEPDDLGFSMRFSGDDHIGDVPVRLISWKPGNDPSPLAKAIDDLKSLT